MNETADGEPKNRGPLAGLVVLDLTRILAGPTCTQLLGDLGAEVWKIEKPGQGDDTRAWGPPYVTGRDGLPTGESAYYLSSNRNKRSVAVDIAKDAGADLVRALAARADVLVENFKTGDLERRGLGPERLLAEHPGLIYCSISGFGRTGPNAHRPGYDLMAQGFAGIMALTGAPEGEPMKVGVGVADVICGLYASVAILAALRHRERTGDGQHIDVALVDCTMAWLVNEGVNARMSGREPIRRGNGHPNIAPYQVFASADGHIIVAAGNDGQFRRFAALLDAPELADDPRFATNQARLAHRDALIAALAPRIAAATTAALTARMEAADVPGGPIHGVLEAFETEQAKARGMAIAMAHPLAETPVPLIGNPLKLSRTPVSYRHAPPPCGQDTEAVLRGALGDAAFDAVAATGALGDRR